MMELVVDSSAVLACFLPDEAAPATLLDRLTADATLWTPALFWYEVANAVAVARRRRRLSQAQCAHIFEMLSQLPIRVDGAAGAPPTARLASLAHEYALSAYDAAYLELAERLGLSLATLDRDLRQAARRAGVEVFRL